MRVIGGEAGGRRLTAPKGRGTRPTSDRAREALFSTVGSLGVELSGARVLDLYAGSGAVGIEALSRGAGHVLLVEGNAATARLVRHNLQVVALPGAEVHVGTVERRLLTSPTAPYHLVFADPPYSTPDDEVAAALVALVERRWLAPGAVVVVERSSRTPAPQWPPGVAAVHERRYGEGTLWYGRRASEA